MKIPYFLKQRFNGFTVLDFKEWITDKKLEILLEPILNIIRDACAAAMLL